MFFSPRWNKIINDLWENKVRTLLIVLGIAVGVLAFGGMFITRDVVLQEMNDSYAATNPATIFMYGSGFDDGTVSAVSALDHVQDVEGWASYYVKMEVDGEWYNIDLYTAKDFENIRVNDVFPELGEWPPDRREIWFERSTMDHVGAEIGDTIRIELSDGTIKELTFAGTLHDLNTVPPALSLWPTGFVSMETLRWLGHPGDYRRLNIVTDPELTEIEDIEVVASDIAERLRHYGYNVGGSYSQRPGEHWAAEPFEAFVVILAAIGVLALLLSGFLVVNTITSVCSQQKRQIGIMKSVGAKSGQIVILYVTMVGVFGLLSLVVAIPLSMVLAYFSADAVANFLNIDINNFHLPSWILALELGAALLIPVVASFIPILGGTRTTVREVVSDFGIKGIENPGWFDRLILRIRGISRPVLLSVRNTFRRKGRLILTLGTLTLAGAIFISILSVRDSLMAELDDVLKLFGHDVEIYLNEAVGIHRLKREAGRVPGVEHVEGWTFTSTYRVRDDGTEGSRFSLFGPPADTPFIQPTLLEGRWLEPGDTNAIVISSEMLKDDPDLAVGQTITLKIGEYQRRWQIVGIINAGLQGSIAYADYNYLSHLMNMPGKSWVVLIGTAEHTQEFQTEVARGLEERFKRSGISVSQSLTLQEITGANVGQFDFLVGFMLVMAVLLAVVGGLGLTSTMSLNVLERTREIGVMRAVGAKNAAVRGVVISEGTLIGLISWLLAVPVSVPLGLGLCAAMGQAFFERPMAMHFSYMGVAIWLGLALVIATIASLVPALRAARISVREALAYE